MNIIRGISAIPDNFVRPVLTIGNFDGVHLGHQELLKRVIKRSAEIGGTSTVVTFEPHPAKILRPHDGPRLLTNLHERLAIFQSFNIKVVVCIEFTREFSKLPPEDFVKDILCKKIGARVIIVGKNYKFGKGQSGDVHYLSELGKSMGFEVEVVDPLEIDGRRVSSSLIRTYLLKGEVDYAAKFLGRHYSIEGIVTKGHHRGVELGYPTANIYTVDEAIPSEGIYAVQVIHGSQIIDGVCYIGSQPTFAGERIGIEVHLFEFHENLYHEHLKILFIQKIREEKKFKDTETLKAQIKKDVEIARNILHNLH